MESVSYQMPMIQGYALVLAFMATGVGFLILPLILQRILAPRKFTEEKLVPYECGEDPVGSPWIQFNIRFYVFALVFLIFDVEVAFLLPWAVAFASPDLKAAAGWLPYWDGVVFVAILVVGFVYLWARGDLRWVRPQPQTSELSERDSKERRILLGRAV